MAEKKRMRRRVVGVVECRVTWCVVGDDDGNEVVFVGLVGAALPAEGRCRPSWRELALMWLLLEAVAVVAVVVVARSLQGDASGCAVGVVPSARVPLPVA